MSKEPCCPGCGSFDYQPRTAPWAEDRAERKDYRCDRCGELFDEPDQREREQECGPGHLSAAGRALYDADPDEVGL